MLVCGFIAEVGMKTRKGTEMLPIGVAIGVSIGVAIGVATDDLALWLSLGVAIGAGMGVAMSARPRRKADDDGDAGPPIIHDGRADHIDGSDGGGDGGGGD